ASCRGIPPPRSDAHRRPTAAPKWGRPRRDSGRPAAGCSAPRSASVFAAPRAWRTAAGRTAQPWSKPSVSWRDCKSVVARRTARRLDGAVLLLGLEATLLRRAGRPCRPAPLRGPRRVLQQRDEPRAGGVAVQRLRAVLPAVDNQDAGVGDAAAGLLDQTL